MSDKIFTKRGVPIRVSTAKDWEGMQILWSSEGI